jgi:DNA repair photolyase
MRLRPVDNPPNPYLSQHAEWLEPPPPARIEVYEETSGSILSENDSPDLPFRWSVNPYRGCQHACSYCYARPYHEYLGLGAGTDFETKLIVKRNAPELLAAEFSRRSWKGERVNFSGITDCYQPLEAAYGLTRRCLEVCAAYRNPAMIVTKSFLVVRDIDVLTELHRRADVSVMVSIPFADGRTAKLIEPQAPPPARRFEAVRRLAEAGIPTGVFVAPVIPGLNDCDIPRILEKAAEAGARSVGYTALRLPGSVEYVFLSRLRETLPLQADRVIHRLHEIRGGCLNDSRFGERMRGHGPYWESIRDMFAVFKRQYGFADSNPFEESSCGTQTCTEPSNNQLRFGFADGAHGFEAK